jgi:C4-dicarboxylate transporter DctM subunit
MGTSKISGYVLTIAKVPTLVANAILSVSDSPIVIMLLINLFLLVVGMFLEANAAIVILTPILLPVATHCGISPVQFGVVMCLNLCMGLVTPPVGGCLTIGNEIAKGRLDRTFIKSLPLIGVECIVLFLVNAVPALSTWLPSL